MSAKMSRALPLLVAPVALVCLAANAVAVTGNLYYDDSNDASGTTAWCEHPNYDGDVNPYTPDVEGLYAQTDITTGGEGAPGDVKSLHAQMVDRNATDYIDWHEDNVHASEFKYTFGIFDGEDFVPTTATFVAGKKLKNGAFSTTKKVSDVQAVKVEAVWRLLHPNVMRTASCVIELGYSPPN